MIDIIRRLTATTFWTTIVIYPFNRRYVGQKIFDRAKVFLEYFRANKKTTLRWVGPTAIQESVGKRGAKVDIISLVAFSLMTSDTKTVHAPRKYNKRVGLSALELFSFVRLSSYRE